jgi:hypothetical protein
MAEDNFVHVLRTNSGIHQRFAGHAHDEAFHAFIAKFTERGMGPPDNTGGHKCLLCRTLVAFFTEEPVTIFVQPQFTGFAYHPKLG